VSDLFWRPADRAGFHPVRTLTCNKQATGAYADQDAVLAETDRRVQAGHAAGKQEAR
jgi:hypothetical protein